MMPNVIEDIRTVIVRILEDWAMMLVEETEPQTSIFELEEPFFLSEVKFKGVVSGRYCVVCQEQFGRNLANNLLGMEEEIDEEQIMDALKEMINVLSGNLLTDTYGADHVFILTSPQVRLAGLPEVEEMFSRPVFCYLGEDNPVAISFALEGVPA